MSAPAHHRPHEPPASTRTHATGARTGFPVAALALVSPGPVRAGDIDLSKLHGKVQVVEHFADYRVKIVNHFPDLKVQWVEHFPDAPGQWQLVEHFPDFTIQVVEHFPGLP